MNETYIKLYRKLSENSISSNLEILWFLSFILLNAKFKEESFYFWLEKITLKPWEFLTSQRKLSMKFWVSLSKINRLIKILESEWIVKHKKNTKYTLLKVINWEIYNWIGTPKEHKQNTNETQKETNKERKELINNNNNIINNNISKDISLLEDESSSENLQVVETFWNDEINKMQDIIKNTIESLDMIYKPWKYERPRIKNIISWKDFWVVCEKHWMSRSDFVISIINLASKLKYAKKINNAVDFYENYASVYNLALQTKKWFLENKREIW